MKQWQEETLVQGLFDWIEACPTAYHTVDQIRKALDRAGFVGLCESEPWTLRAGKRYYVTRNDSSVLAFRLPPHPEEATGYQVVAAHGDSPSFKLKADCEEVVLDHYTKLNVEKYGGMICSTWLDRPLSVAGRVMIRNEAGEIESRLVRVDRDLALIPNVAIHMNRNINDGFSFNPQVDMLPLVGEKSTNSLKNQFASEIGVKEEQILTHDLFLYVRQRGSRWGVNEEYISAPHLDDLMCVYTALQAFLSVSVNCDVSCMPNSIPMLAVFDNEEVGSATRQGASSSMIEDTVARIEHAIAGKNPDGRYCRMANSMMLSADNAHAVHPNHPEYADAQNRPYMNGGIVVKCHAGQAYSTDAVSAALFSEICKRAEVPMQTFANRSDMRGGSTLGNLAATRVPFLTVDIGLAQLAMHSAYETAGAKDLGYMARACEVFYRSAVISDGAGKYRLVQAD